MKLSHFNFDLPEELLAEHPAEHRDESRLMVLDRANQKIEHKLLVFIFLVINSDFPNLPKEVCPGGFGIFNSHR